MADFTSSSVGEKLDLFEHDVDSVRRSPILDASAFVRKATTWLVRAASARVNSHRIANGAAAGRPD
jgi:hypothetical protein